MYQKKMKKKINKLTMLIILYNNIIMCGIIALLTLNENTLIDIL